MILATAMEVIQKRGAFFSYNDMRLGQGRENAKEFLRQNIELCNEIERTVRERVMGGEIPMDLGTSADTSGEDEIGLMVSHQLGMEVDFLILSPPFTGGCDLIGLTRPVPAEEQSPLFIAPTFQRKSIIPTQGRN